MLDHAPSPRPRRVSPSARLLALTGLLALSAFGCGQPEAAPAPPAPPSVGVATPVERTVTEWDEYTGRLSAVDSVLVRPRVSGYVQRIHFEEGSLVDAGDLLFTLDPRTFRAALAEAQAETHEAEVRLELARTELARVEALDSRAVSREEIDRRRHEVRVAEAALASARAGEESAALDLEFARVVSPVSGRVGRAQVTEGNLATGGSGTATVLTTVVSIDPIYLYFTPDERAALDYLRRQRSAGGQGVPVEMELADESGFPRRGQLDFVDNRVDEETGTLLVRAVFDNPDAALLPGLFARVRLQTRPPAPALMVPEKAITQDQTREIVLVVGADGVVERREVSTGPTLDGMTVVREGLGAGERVVVEGIQRARPGSPVTPEPVQVSQAASGVPAP